MCPVLFSPERFSWHFCSASHAQVRAGADEALIPLQEPGLPQGKGAAVSVRSGRMSALILLVPWPVSRLWTPGKSISKPSSAGLLTDCFSKDKMAHPGENQPGS